MKILILTNHLAQFGGSEIVALEVAEVFRELNCDVSIFAAHIDDPMRSLLSARNLNFGIIEDCPDPADFDIIWSQHHLIAHLATRFGAASLATPFLITVSLSPYEPLEIPGAIAEVANLVLANSPETAERLAELGIADEKIEVFYNAAPGNFNQTSDRVCELKKLLIISNHAPEEIGEAAEQLRSQGLTVDHIGLPANPVKITPELIRDYDALISIGKSVQYAILSETPVYVYDRFGGPGWLTEYNVAEAEKFNFSGRCCHRKLTANAIADEIIYGFSEAASSIQNIKTSHSEKYILNNYLRCLLARTAQIRPPKALNPAITQLLYREGLLHQQLFTFYRLVQEQSSMLSHLRHQAESLHQEIARLSDGNASPETTMPD